MIKQIENKLLKRKEVIFEIESESNPGLSKIKSEIAQLTKSQEDLVVIKSLKSSFGNKKFLAEALVYNSLEDKNKIEPAIKQIKNQPKQEAVNNVRKSKWISKSKRR